MAIWLEKEYALIDRCKLVCVQQRRRVVIIFEVLGVASVGVVAALVIAIGERRWRSSHRVDLRPVPIAVGVATGAMGATEAVPAPRW